MNPYLYAPTMVGALYARNQSPPLQQLAVPIIVNLSASGVAINYLLGYGTYSPMGVAISGIAQMGYGYMTSGQRKARMDTGQAAAAALSNPIGLMLDTQVALAQASASSVLPKGNGH